MDWDSADKVASFFEHSVATLGIIVGGIWAYFKYEKYERRAEEDAAMAIIDIEVKASVADRAKRRILFSSTATNKGKVHVPIDLDQSRFIVQRLTFKGKVAGKEHRPFVNLPMNIAGLCAVRAGTSFTVDNLIDVTEAGVYRVCAYWHVSGPEAGLLTHMAEKAGKAEQNDKPVVWHSSVLLKVD